MKKKLAMQAFLSDPNILDEIIGEMQNNIRGGIKG
jgi:hypothetical protein